MLEADGRQNMAALARQLGVGIHTVGRRLDRLIGSGSLQVMATVDPSKVGRPLHAMICLKLSPQKIQSTITELCKHPSVMVIQRAMGRFDLVVSMWFFSVADLETFLRVTLPAMPGVKTSETSIMLNIAKGRLTQLSPYFIDSKDRDLISLLQEDPRRSNSSIAAALDISCPTVGRRVDHLLADGTVTVKAIGPQARDPKAVRAQLRIRAECKSIAATIAALVAHPQVGWIGSCTGPFDVMAFVSAPSTEEIARFSNTELHRIKGVIEVEYLLILDLVPYYKLRHQEYWKHLNPPGAMTPPPGRA
jgi:DNA-binding Lrp family transcriptional regulator